MIESTSGFLESKNMKVVSTANQKIMQIGVRIMFSIKLNRVLPILFNCVRNPSLYCSSFSFTMSLLERNL